MNAKEAREFAESVYNKELESEKATIQIKIDQAAKAGKFRCNIDFIIKSEVRDFFKGKGFYVGIPSGRDGTTSTEITW